MFEPNEVHVSFGPHFIVSSGPIKNKEYLKINTYPLI